MAKFFIGGSWFHISSFLIKVRDIAKRGSSEVSPWTRASIPSWIVSYSSTFAILYQALSDGAFQHPSSKDPHFFYILTAWKAGVTRINRGLGLVYGRWYVSITPSWLISPCLHRYIRHHLRGKPCETLNWYSRLERVYGLRYIGCSTSCAFFQTLRLCKSAFILRRLAVLAWTMFQAWLAGVPQNQILD